MWRRHRRAGWLGSQTAAEVLEGAFSGQEGSPSDMWVLHPRLGFTAYSNRAGKETQITSTCEKHRDTVSQGKMARDAESLLKVRHTKFHCSHLPWALVEGRQSGLEMLEERLGLVALGRELKEPTPGSLCLTVPHAVEAILPKQSTLLQMASA